MAELTLVESASADFRQLADVDGLLDPTADGPSKEHSGP
jgi:hypothetical protein